MEAGRRQPQAMQVAGGERGAAGPPEPVPAAVRLRVDLVGSVGLEQDPGDDARPQEHRHTRNRDYQGRQVQVPGSAQQKGPAAAMGQTAQEAAGADSGAGPRGPGQQRGFRPPAASTWW